MSQYCRGISGILAVIDLTRSETIDDVIGWIMDVWKLIPSPVPIIMVGNKSDLTDIRQVSKDHAMIVAQQLGSLYLETSACDDININLLFHSISQLVYQMIRRNTFESQSSMFRLMNTITTIEQDSDKERSRHL